MAAETAQFRVVRDGGESALAYERDSIYLGRLDTCEVVLDDPSVSRIHAGVSFSDGKFSVANLSSSNPITLNGRALSPEESDVIADGDVIQIGPFVVNVTKDQNRITLAVKRQATARSPQAKTENNAASATGAADVLRVFWEKRSREKEDWGSRLRPTEEPRPGKAMYNWRPTADLRRQWRFGVFVWAVIVFGAIGAFAYLKYPQAYSPKPLSDPHSRQVDQSSVAAVSNSNSCTTCHTPNEPIENSCIRCHQAEGFHATNTKAHQDAGITCTVCHREHQGSDFQITKTAVESCAACHNDTNKTTYNGNSVHTPHRGSYGYPAADGVWKWKGVYAETAAAIPEINSSATGDRDDQMRLSRQFHTIHVARLKVPSQLKGDARGLVSCSTCHKSFDPVDRETPKQTCSVCHTTPAGVEGRDMRFGVGGANCISCHVQHPYSTARWSEFLTDESLDRRNKAVTAGIEALKNK